MKTGKLKCARLEFSGCRVRAPAAWSGGAAGVSHDSPRAQTCTFEGPGLQKHHQNSTGRHPEREEKNEFCGGRGKKSAKLWAPHTSGPHPSGPHFGAPPFETHFFWLMDWPKMVKSGWPKSVCPKSVASEQRVRRTKGGGRTKGRGKKKEGRRGRKKGEKWG